MSKSSTGTTQSTNVPSHRTSDSATIVQSGDVVRYIESLVDYTLADIRKLLEVAIESQDNIGGGYSRCSTALASLCFATIEQIGFCFQQGVNPQNIEAVAEDGRLNARQYFRTFNSYGNPVTDGEVEALYMLFRNRITHNLFPAFGLGVSQDKGNPFDTLVVSDAGKMSLNVNFIAKHVEHTILFLSANKIHLATRPHTFAENMLLVEPYLLQRVKGQFTGVSNQARALIRSWLPLIQFPK